MAKEIKFRVKLNIANQVQQLTNAMREYQTSNAQFSQLTGKSGENLCKFLDTLREYPRYFKEAQGNEHWKLNRWFINQFSPILRTG